MGASEWSHFTPWQEDIDAAMQALQQQVAAETDLDPMEALMTAGEDGTHSIVDLFAGCSLNDYDARDESEDFMAFAAPKSWLMKTYGTIRPTRKMIEEIDFEVAELIERGTGVYFAAWDQQDAQGDPQWWYFYGCSGD